MVSQKAYAGTDCRNSQDQMAKVTQPEATEQVTGDSET